MSFRSDMEDAKKLWGQSSWQSRLLLILTVFLSSGSIAGLSDQIFKWKGAILVAIDFYKSTFPVFITEVFSHIGVDFPGNESDTLIIATIWFGALTRLYKVKSHYKDIMLGDLYKESSDSYSMQYWSEMSCWTKLTLFLESVKKWILVLILYLGLVLWLILDQMDVTWIPITFIVLYVTGLMLLIRDYYSLPPVETSVNKLNEFAAKSMRKEFRLTKRLLVDKVLARKNILSYTFIPGAALFLVLLLSMINHGLTRA